MLWEQVYLSGGSKNFLNMTNTLLTITGPSLSGKSTLEDMLVRIHVLEKIVSFTTRPIRAGEVNGEQYHFLKREEAEKKIEADEVAEYTEFDGNFYGILGSELETKLQKNSCIAVVEPKGLNQLSIYCRGNGIGHKAVYLTNTPEVLAARFLHRFRNNEQASPVDYASRLVSLIRDEQAWIHKFEYHAIYLRFDRLNEGTVLREVVSLVGDK